MTDGLPRATVRENLALATTFFLPSLARGTITSSPRGHALTTRLDTMARAQRVLSGLRERYGGRSVLVRGVSGPTVLVLARADVERVLTGSDEVFTLASREKLSGLGPFLDGTLLLSRGGPRNSRSAFATSVLGSSELDEGFARIAAEEAATLVPGVLTYSAVNDCWNRVARRCLYGEGARDDTELSEVLAGLRRAGNWLGVRRGTQARLSARYDALIAGHLRRAEPGSLAGLIPALAPDAEVCPARQAAFWLMGFTVPPPGLLQALALLASFPAGSPSPSYVRACLLEGLRLWAPVPALMRTITEEVIWDGETLPAGTGVLIPLILHARSPQLPYADRFAPEIWLDGTAEAEWLLGPFSRGPGQCKGMNLALHVGTAFLGAMLALGRPVLERPLGDPLPLMLDTMHLRLTMEPRLAEEAR